MVKDIAELLKDRLTGAVYVDRISGLVQTINESSLVDKKTVVHKYPVSCDVDSLNCGEDTSRLKDLIPDSRKRTVIYFEDINGMSFVERKRNDLIFEADLRLVCWINGQQLGKTNCFVSGAIMADVIKRLVTVSPFNSNPYIKVNVKVNKIPLKSPALFSRYTYDDKMQYLVYPYDYFAIDFRVTYSMNVNCLADFNLDPVDECNTH